MIVVVKQLVELSISMMDPEFDFVVRGLEVQLGFRIYLTSILPAQAPTKLFLVQLWLQSECGCHTSETEPPGNEHWCSVFHKTCMCSPTSVYMAVAHPVMKNEIKMFCKQIFTWHSSPKCFLFCLHSSIALLLRTGSLPLFNRVWGTSWTAGSSVHPDASFCACVVVMHVL